MAATASFLRPFFAPGRVSRSSLSVGVRVESSSVAVSKVVCQSDDLLGNVVVLTRSGSEVSDVMTGDPVFFTFSGLVDGKDYYFSATVTFADSTTVSVSSTKVTWDEPDSIKVLDPNLSEVGVFGDGVQFDFSSTDFDLPSYYEDDPTMLALSRVLSDEFERIQYTSEFVRRAASPSTAPAAAVPWWESTFSTTASTAASETGTVLEWGDRFNAYRTPMRSKGTSAYYRARLAATRSGLAEALAEMHGSRPLPVLYRWDGQASDRSRAGLWGAPVNIEGMVGGLPLGGTATAATVFPPLRSVATPQRNFVAPYGVKLSVSGSGAGYFDGELRTDIGPSNTSGARPYPNTQHPRDWLITARIWSSTAIQATMRMVFPDQSVVWPSSGSLYTIPANTWVDMTIFIQRSAAIPIDAATPTFRARYTVQGATAGTDIYWDKLGVFYVPLGFGSTLDPVTGVDGNVTWTPTNEGTYADTYVEDVTHLMLNRLYPIGSSFQAIAIQRDSAWY